MKMGQILQGLIIGIVFVLGGSIQAASIYLNNPGFEVSEPLVGDRPTTEHNWQGDNAELVGAQNGISPLSGSKMLRFINSGTVPGDGNGAEQWQLISLNPILSLVQTGNVEVSVSTFFNRIAGDAQTDTSFLVCLSAYNGLLSDFPQKWKSAELNGLSIGSLMSDSNANTWESAQATLLLPTNATYIAIMIGAVENIQNDLVNPEFDGHYADAVVFEYSVIPEPSALFLVLVGLFILRKKRFNL